MKPKELTPEEIVEELWGKKEYFKYGEEKRHLKERLKTKQLCAWSREHHEDNKKNNRSFTIEIKTPSKCTGLTPRKIKCRCGKNVNESRGDFEFRYRILGNPGMSHCETIYREKIKVELEKKHYKYANTFKKKW